MGGNLGERKRGNSWKSNQRPRTKSEGGEGSRLSTKGGELKRLGIQKGKRLFNLKGRRIPKRIGTRSKRNGKGVTSVGREHGVFVREERGGIVERRPTSALRRGGCKKKKGYNPSKNIIGWWGGLKKSLKRGERGEGAVVIKGGSLGEQEGLKGGGGKCPGKVRRQYATDLSNLRAQGGHM